MGWDREYRTVCSPEVQSNGQAQAGAAAQLVINLFFVTADGAEWTVKPIAFHTEGATSRPAQPQPGVRGGAGRQGGGKTQTDVEVAAEAASNAQGQGLHVGNEVNMLELIGEALGLAAVDPDVRDALRQRG